ncbi:MAG: AAA family ATPase [Chloroflexota bacterium]
MTVFSPKGGSGCTTIAINLAVGLAKRNQKVVLVDASLQFGDVAVMMNMKSITSIIDIVERMNELDPELVSTVVQVHRSGVHVLLAPPRPEMADVVTDQNLLALIEVLRQMYDFVIVDTSSNLNDITLGLLDVADQIVLVTQQSLPSLKNVSRFFDLSEGLKYKSDKVWLVVNRSVGKSGISVKDISNILKRPIIMTIPIGDSIANAAADQGVPIVSGAGLKEPIGMALNKLTEHVMQELANKQPTSNGRVDSDLEEAPKGMLGKLFGRKS